MTHSEEIREKVQRMFENVNKAEFTKTINHIKRQKQKRDELDADIKYWENMVKDLLENYGIDKLNLGTNTITYSTYERNSFDSQKLKVVNPELYDQYKKTQIIKRLAIK